MAGGNVDIRRVPVEKWEDVKVITRHLTNHSIVLIDISAIPADLARRVLDFVFGVVYVIDGKLERVDTKTFMATPANVNFSSEKRTRKNNRQEETNSNMFMDSEDY